MMILSRACSAPDASACLTTQIARASPNGQSCVQACDLVPIVEPEILTDGEYDIQRSSAVSQEVLQVCHAL